MMNKVFRTEQIMYVLFLVPIINGKIWFAGDVIPGLNITVPEAYPIESSQASYQGQQTYQPMPQGTYQNQQRYQPLPQTTHTTTLSYPSYQHQQTQKQYSQQQPQPPQQQPQPPQKPQPPPSASASSSMQGHQPSSSASMSYEEIITLMVSTAVKKIALSLDHTDGAQVKNLLIAPLSVFGALTLVLLGAQGVTKREIENFLGLSDRSVINEDILHKAIGLYFDKFVPVKGVEVGHQLAFANSIFIQKDFSIKPRFDEIARNEYKSEVFPVDFLNHREEARKIINKWIENKTFGRIKDIVPDRLSPTTTVVIANALYFNGNWEYPFYGKTRVGKFRVSPTEEIEMPLMVNGAEIPFYRNKEFEMFGMPYKGSVRMMFIIMPQKDLHQFTADLQPESIEDMINLTKVQLVMYAVPRMKIETSIDLKKSLEQLGMPSMFDPLRANLSGIAEGLYTSEIYHKVEILVTETGTEAAAGTATGLVRGGIPMVRVDRPFIFFIYHKPTKSITFWGNVYKPTPYFDKKETN